MIKVKFTMLDVFLLALSSKDMCTILSFCFFPTETRGTDRDLSALVIIDSCCMMSSKTWESQYFHGIQCHREYFLAVENTLCVTNISKLT